MRKLTRSLNPATFIRSLATALVCGLVLVAPTAHAYVGPGLGLGALAVIIGIVLSILIALIAIVWYPIKRRMAARSRPTEGEGG